MDRDLDGIYVKIQRDGRERAVCLSDMTNEELDEVLADKNTSWLRGAVKHLAQELKLIGDLTNYSKEY